LAHPDFGLLVPVLQSTIQYPFAANHAADRPNLPTSHDITPSVRQRRERTHDKLIQSTAPAYSTPNLALSGMVLMTEGITFTSVFLVF